MGVDAQYGRVVMALRILHVMAGAATGGAEIFFLDAVCALHEAGFEQAVVTRGNAPHRLAELRKRNIRTELTSFNRMWRWTSDSVIDGLVKSFKPDLIQYWMGRAGTFAKPRDVPQLGWYGGYYATDRFRHCDFHVGVSHDIVRHIVSQGVPENRAATLHTFAAFTPAPAVARSEFDTPDGVPLFLALARLHWKKGLDNLLDAMAQVPGAYLWIAGDGPLEKELKVQTARLGLDDRVRFLGWRNDREALLAAADICVFPSRYEPFGTVTVEAWASGTPLIATAAQGPRAYVTHGEDGLLVPVDDTDALAAAMNRLAADPALRVRLVENGMASYEKGFTKAVYQHEAARIFQQVIAAHAAMTAPA